MDEFNLMKAHIMASIDGHNNCIHHRKYEMILQKKDPLDSLHMFAEESVISPPLLFAKFLLSEGLSTTLTFMAFVKFTRGRPSRNSRGNTRGFDFWEILIVANSVGNLQGFPEMVIVKDDLSAVCIDFCYFLCVMHL
ncbi:hypothetical protein DMENIID0001_068860 [Sergentomyia squamirostris]